MNTLGTRFRLMTYGESHGAAVGGVIDGCPPGLLIDTAAVADALARRRVGAPRAEDDRVDWLSGIAPDGRTLGTPIAFEIANTGARSADYDKIRDLWRPGHADYTYTMRYGLRDHRGGGRASARETAARVVAGAVAKMVVPHVKIATRVEETSQPAEDDTCGGIVKCTIEGVPAGIGEPIFGKLNATLAAAMMSIPSAIGFEMGAGFAAAHMRGSEYIDRWNPDASTNTNHCGGVQGGISNGMPIEFRVAFHPVPTLPQSVECLAADGRMERIVVGGRHDRCHVPRAAVVVEAMAAICIADLTLQRS